MVIDTSRDNLGGVVTLSSKSTSIASLCHLAAPGQSFFDQVALHSVAAAAVNHAVRPMEALLRLSFAYLTCWMAGLASLAAPVSTHAQSTAIAMLRDGSRDMDFALGTWRT